MKPANVRPPSDSSVAALTSPRATASTRRPAAASRSFTATSALRPRGVDGDLAVRSRQSRAQLEDAAGRALCRAPQPAARAVERCHQLALARERDHAQRRWPARFRAVCRHVAPPPARHVDRIHQGAGDVSGSILGLRIRDGRRLLRLASAAVAEQRRRVFSRRAAPSDRMSTSRPFVQTRTTVISPDVKVLVLSVQTTVVEPSVSTAGSRRTSACRLAMRRMPTASAIVATAGSASGTAATASAMPVSIDKAEGRTLDARPMRRQGGDRKREPDETAAERVEPALEGRALLRHRSDECADATRPRLPGPWPRPPHVRSPLPRSCPCKAC